VCVDGGDHEARARDAHDQADLGGIEAAASERAAHHVRPRAAGDLAVRAVLGLEVLRVEDLPRSGTTLARVSTPRSRRRRAALALLVARPAASPAAAGSSSHSRTHCVTSRCG
jgi:hypothetical protein